MASGGSSVGDSAVRGGRGSSSHGGHSGRGSRGGQRRDGRGSGRGSRGVRGVRGSRGARGTLSIPKSKARDNRRSNLASRMSSVMEANSFPRNAKVPHLSSPYNQWNAFYSQQTPDEIFATLMTLLKDEDDIDIDFHDSSYKIRARKFKNNMLCQFQVCFFKKTTLDIMNNQKISRKLQCTFLF